MAKPHQLTFRNGAQMLGVVHDQNGNVSAKQTPSDFILNAYDQMNRLVTSAYYFAGNQQSQKYDYSGRRVFRQVGSTQERYFSRLVELEGDVVTKYYYAGGRLVAARWNHDPGFGSGSPAATPLQIPPELPVAIGVAAILLLIGFGRRERRILIAVGPSRALGASLLIIAAAPPVGLFTAEAAQAECDPDIYTVHYHADHLGSTQVISNSDGSIQQQIRYTAYGQVRGRWDATGAAAGPGPLGLTREFTGYESDDLTGFQYAGARFYDPELGQFLSHDPQRQFASPYAYGPGDPMNGTDPNGEFFPAWVGTALFYLAVGAMLGSAAYSGYSAAKAGASIHRAILASVGQLATAVATSGVLGPVIGGIGQIGGATAAYGVQAALIGYGTYNTVQAARSGEVAAAVNFGLNTVYAAYGFAAGDTTSGLPDNAYAANGGQGAINTDTGLPDDPTLARFIRDQGPPPPPGVSVDQNIARIREVAEVGGRDVAFGWWVNQVREEGAWDYKYHFGLKYEAFGNYNYAATGRALGLSPEVLHRAAGAVGVLTGNAGPGSPLGAFPYGDSYTDQAFISDGIRYFDRKY